MLVSMTAFWDVMQELLNITKPSRLVEIGGDQGECTQKFCAWANSHNAYVHVIEIQPADALKRIVEQYQFARLHVGLSLELLPTMEGVACFVVDGDHNYYTVYNELKLIFQYNKPDLILLHDTGWPWGRRDLYYDVNTIPNEYRNDPVTDPNLGILPGHEGVFPEKGLRSNGQFAFARVEGGSKNGVRTAVQDFLVENSDYELFTIDCVFGLGILVPKSTAHYSRVVNVLTRYVANPLIALLEEDRLQSFVNSLNSSQPLPSPIVLSSNVQTDQLAYIDLMKRIILDLIYPEPDKLVKDVRSKQLISIREARLAGLIWPERALTMIGLERLNNLQFCVEDVLQRGIPGDFIETGVWRGGSCIFIRSILKAYSVTDRMVWVADSFQGLPKPDSELYPLDKNLDLSGQSELAVSRTEVAQNFERFGLLDRQVQFLEGWFKDTLGAAPIKQLAVLRLDGDLYQSTMEALVALYPKVMPGGYVIIDDYGAVEQCRRAVNDYRDQHGITEEIYKIDWTGAYWQRTIR
jgi:O-methyltransferase